MSDQLYLLLATILVATAALPATAFVFLYGVFSPWEKSREGVQLFGFTATIAVLLDLSLFLRILGHEFPGVRHLALVIYAFIAVFMWQRLALWRRADRWARRARFRAGRLETEDEPPTRTGDTSDR